MLLCGGRVPYEVATTFSEEELTAHLIIQGQQRGGVWDWDEMNWSKDPQLPSFFGL